MPVGWCPPVAVSPPPPTTGYLRPCWCRRWLRRLQCWRPVGAGGRAPACDRATDRVGPAAGFAAAEAPVPTCRSSLSTRRTRLRIIASRWRTSFWSCSIVGSLDWACAAIEPGNALPNNASNVVNRALTISSCGPTALNLGRFESQSDGLHACCDDPPRPAAPRRNMV